MRTIAAAAVLFLATMSAARADGPSDVLYLPNLPTTPKVVSTGAAFGTGTIRIPRIAWLSDANPLMRALHVTSTDGRGTVVVFAALADTRFYYVVTGPQVRASLAGSSRAEREETSSWYLATWDRAIRPFLNDGENAVYLVRNVPKPTAEHPLTRVAFVGAHDPEYASDLVSGVPRDPRESQTNVLGSGPLQSDPYPSPGVPMGAGSTRTPQ